MEHVLGQNTTQYGGMDTKMTFLLMFLYHQLEDNRQIDKEFFLDNFITEYNCIGMARLTHLLELTGI